MHFGALNCIKHVLNSNGNNTNNKNIYKRVAIAKGSVRRIGGTRKWTTERRDTRTVTHDEARVISSEDVFDSRTVE